MRTIVDIPDDMLLRLDAWASRAKISRAEAVRRAVASAVKEQDPDDIAQFFGALKHLNIDGLEWQRKLRAEWDD